MQPPDDAAIQSYIEKQQAFINSTGLKAGDRVKITRKPTDYEEGWDNSWTEDMDEAFNLVGVVRDFGMGADGITINFPDLFFHMFSYPFFIIEKV